MQRSSLLLLALAALMASTVSAQAVQSGLLYWCSFVEGGSNFVSGPRSFWNNGPPNDWSAPCHLPYNSNPASPGNIPTYFDGTPYVYTNGSAYPIYIAPNGPNPADAVYNIAPSVCLVRST